MEKIVKQWVNLPKNEKFSEGEITLARCGTVSVKLTFATDNFPLTYFVKVVPVGSENVVYSEGEQARNRNFNLPEEIMGVANNETEIVEGIQLPAAGGNQYKIEVKDENGKKVATEEAVFEVQRKLYYQVIVMDDTNDSAPSDTRSLATMEAEYLRHFITLARKGAEKRIPYIKTVILDGNDSNESYFDEQIAAAFRFDSDFNKLEFAAVFVDYIATMADYKYQAEVVIGEKPNPRCVWDEVEVKISDTKELLWHGMDDKHDRVKKWFKSGQVVYTDLKGVITTYIIKREDIDISGRRFCSYGGYAQVKIKIDTALKALLQKQGGQLTFTILVNIVSDCSGGLNWAYKGVKIIALAKRDWWESTRASERELTWIHEVGHRFGMVAYGDKNYPTNSKFRYRPTLPDAPSTLYGENSGVNDCGHAGAHCNNGADYNISDKTWSGRPGCIMFGADNIESRHAPKSYCSECAPIVRKLDLSRI